MTYFIFTDKWGGAGWRKACESPASYSGSVVYVGEQGGVWRGESLGGVCYQGTEPNSWLILELLERKSRGLTFPAVFLFLQKIVLEIHVWKEMQHVFNFEGHFYRSCIQNSLHPEEKAPLSVSVLFEEPHLKLLLSWYCIIMIYREHLYSDMTVTFCVSWSFSVLRCLWLHVINFSWTVRLRGYL